MTTSVAATFEDPVPVKSVIIGHCCIEVTNLMSLWDISTATGELGIANRETNSDYREQHGNLAPPARTFWATGAYNSTDYAADQEQQPAASYRDENLFRDFGTFATSSTASASRSSPTSSCGPRRAVKLGRNPASSLLA